MFRWIVVTERSGEHTFLVRLVEVRELTSGPYIATGRRTPNYGFDARRGSYDTLAQSLGRAIEVLTAESIMKADEESMMVAAEMAEQLGDLLGAREVE